MRAHRAKGRFPYKQYSTPKDGKRNIITDRKPGGTRGKYAQIFEADARVSEYTEWRDSERTYHGGVQDALHITQQ